MERINETGTLMAYARKFQAEIEKRKTEGSKNSGSSKVSRVEAEHPEEMRKEPYAERLIASRWSRYSGAYAETLEENLVNVFLRALDEHRGVYIFGGVGTGKTWALVAMFRLLGNDQKDAALWTYLDMLDQIKKDFGQDTDEWLRYFCEIPFLLVDDIGSGRGTPWQTDRLYAILDARNRAMKPTYFTSNHNLNQIADVLNQAHHGGGIILTGDGDRVKSRLTEHCIGYRMDGKDRRSQ